MDRGALRKIVERALFLVWRPEVASVGVFVILSLFTILAWQGIRASEQNAGEERFTKLAYDLEEPIIARLNSYAEVLRAGRGFFAGSHDVQRDEWANFVRDLDITNSVPGLTGVGFAELIEASTSTTPGAMLRSGLDPSVTVTAVAGRTTYVPVVYLAPASTANEKFVGLDVLTIPDAAAEFADAMRTNDIGMTGVMDITAGAAKPLLGSVMFAPLRGAASARQESQGFVFAVFPFASLLSGAAAGSGANIDIHIYDGDRSHADDAHLIYDLQDGASKHAEAAGFVPRYALFDTVVVFGKTWTFEFHSQPAYEKAESYAESFAILIEGLAISVFASVLLFFVMNRRKRAEDMASAMTLDLETSKHEIEKRALEAERLNKLMVAREMKIVELKKQAGVWREPSIDQPPVVRAVRGPILFPVHKITARIASRRTIAVGTTEMIFSLSRPMQFHAGQYVTIVLPALPSAEGVHDFSVASSSEDANTIAIIFRESDSLFKRWLHQAPDGAEVIIEGPKGTLLLPTDNEQSVVCLGGGVGVSPFVSMALAASTGKAQRDLTLVSFNASSDKEPYGDMLRALAREHPPFRYISVYGDVTKASLTQLADRVTTAVWYIAGPPGMVESAKRFVADLGVPLQRVREENFTGYSV